jgi:putative FmdB family regulatory protein
MPLYEYRCLNCNETFEVRQKFSDEPVAVHAECGGQGKRLLSTPQLHFKGSGFYITDYGKGGKDAIKPVNPNPKKESKTESKSDSKPETKSESKTETKTETKTESKPAPAAAATKSE